MNGFQQPTSKWISRVAGQSPNHIRLGEHASPVLRGPGNPEPLVGSGQWSTNTGMDSWTHLLPWKGEKQS